MPHRPAAHRRHAGSRPGARLRASLLFPAILLLAPAAAAEPTGDREMALQWANKAIERFDAGDYAGAISAIEEAERHSRAPTFQRLRARALDRLGRLIEAREAYRVIAAWPMSEDAAPVWREAKSEAPQKIGELDGRIPKLLVSVEGAPSPGVTVDGAPLDAKGLGRPIEKDPGKHRVTASGEGAPTAEREVLLEEGEIERVKITLTPGQKVAGLGIAPALSGFGAGAAGLALGAVFGGLAASKKGEVLTGIDACGGACSATEKARLDGVLGDARLFAGVSTAGFVLTGVGAAAGVTLLLVARRSNKETPPALRITMGSVSFSGSF